MWWTLWSSPPIIIGKKAKQWCYSIAHSIYNWPKNVNSWSRWIRYVSCSPTSAIITSTPPAWWTSTSTSRVTWWWCACCTSWWGRSCCSWWSSLTIAKLQYGDSEMLLILDWGMFFFYFPKVHNKSGKFKFLLMKNGVATSVFRVNPTSVGGT